MRPQILKGPNAIYPVEHKNLGRFFFDTADTYSDRICQIDGTIDKTETYASVKQRSTRLAIELQKRGVTSDHVITFCSSNTLDITIAIIAATYLGAKITNLEKSLSVRHTKHLLSLVTPKVIFVEDSAIGLIENSLTDTSFKTEIIVFGTSDKYSVFADLVLPQEHEDEFQPSDVGSDEMALMFFSSGTTGLPKAICHSHFNILGMTSYMYQYGLGKAVFQFPTFYWMTAVGMLGSAFKSGSYRVFCRNPNAEDIFRIIEKYKVGLILVAPILTYQLTNFDKIEEYDTSSLRCIACAGTRTASSQILRLNEVFKSAVSASGYGMSEVGPVTGFDLDANQELVKQKISSCGKPAPELHLKVVDPDTDELLGPNQNGEIRIKTPVMMTGYYKADSSEVFDKDNFLKTGDVGYYDEDGYVYLLERIKEMFKYKSWHIVPSSLEAVLLEHPAVKEAVVFGIPCGADGEFPAASVVLKEGFSATEAELGAFLETQVADFEKLRGGVTFTKVLPRTPTGKVVRKDVRDSVLKSACANN